MSAASVARSTTMLAGTRSEGPLDRYSSRLGRSVSSSRSRIIGGVTVLKIGMAGSGIHVDRARRLLASPRVPEKKPPRQVEWPILHPEPADLAALYQLCDGVLLDDGVRLFGRGEV